MHNRCTEMLCIITFPYVCLKLYVSTGIERTLNITDCTFKHLCTCHALMVELNVTLNKDVNILA